WIKRNFFISLLAEEGTTSSPVRAGLASRCWSVPWSTSSGAEETSSKASSSTTNRTFRSIPVIKIPFASISYREISLSTALNDELDRIAYSYGHSLAGQSLSVKFGELIKVLHTASGQKVVVFIDEYDKPLIDYLDKDSLPCARQNRSVLKSFYSVLKNADPNLKLVFITILNCFIY
ncbi:AAA family ATPase, partial [Thermaurantimonas aggregans]|uniref:AAA family ATPase n=1 Tax=Thermaurantimonas aggregans TaxID=2173829 RepID=UPI0023F4C5DD